MCRLYLHQTRYAETAVRAAQRQVFNCRQKVTLCFSAPPTTTETLIPQSVARRAKEGCLAVAGTPALSLPKGQRNTTGSLRGGRRPTWQSQNYLAPTPRGGGYFFHFRLALAGVTFLPNPRVRGYFSFRPPQKASAGHSRASICHSRETCPEQGRRNGNPQVLNFVLWLFEFVLGFEFRNSCFV